jgi:hypothetical protein
LWLKSTPEEVEEVFDRIHEYAIKYFAHGIKIPPFDSRVKMMLTAAYREGGNSLDNSARDIFGFNFPVSEDRMRRGFTIDSVIIKLIKESNILHNIQRQL